MASAVLLFGLAVLHIPLAVYILAFAVYFLALAVLHLPLAKYNIPPETPLQTSAPSKAPFTFTHGTPTKRELT